jgi:hypothetical protein
MCGETTRQANGRTNTRGRAAHARTPPPPQERTQDAAAIRDAPCAGGARRVAYHFVKTQLTISPCPPARLFARLSTMSHALMVTVRTPTGPVSVEVGLFRSGDSADEAMLAVQWAAIELADAMGEDAPCWWAGIAVNMDEASSDVLDEVPSSAQFVSEALAQGMAQRMRPRIGILCGLYNGTLSVSEANDRTLSVMGNKRICALRGSIVEPWTEGAIEDLRRAIARFDALPA